MSKVISTPITPVLTRRSFFVASAATAVLPAACVLPAMAEPTLSGEALMGRYVTWLYHERIAALNAYLGEDLGIERVPLYWKGDDAVAEAFVNDGGDVRQRAASVLASLKLDR